MAQSNEVRQANRLLAGALKAAWMGAKLMARVAVRIPGWFLRANRRHLEERRQGPSKRVPPVKKEM